MKLIFNKRKEDPYVLVCLQLCWVGSDILIGFYLEFIIDTKTQDFIRNEIPEQFSLHTTKLTWRRGDNDWILICGWTVPLSQIQSPFHCRTWTWNTMSVTVLTACKFCKWLCTAVSSHTHYWEVYSVRQIINQISFYIQHIHSALLHVSCTHFNKKYNL